MFGMLHITAPNAAKRTIEISRATTIGRDADNDIVLNDQAVSRCHALLLAQPGGVALVDLESTNGTFVNDVLVSPDQQITLRDGDVIMIGAALLRYDAPARPRTSLLDTGAQPRAVWLKLDWSKPLMGCAG
jgi:pSer/pThr/pTyr-binding forkhead associated (FHA) protein